MNPIVSIANRINKPCKKNKYKILTYATHESYQTALAETGHEFLLLRRQGAKEWETKYKPLPKNTHVLDRISDTEYDIDFILSHERFGQLQISKQISTALRLPIVHVEHIEPQTNNWSEEYFNQLKSVKADINVFITEHNKNSWGCESGVVVKHGIRTNLFSGWNTNLLTSHKYVLYIVNWLEQRDQFCGYSEWMYVKNKVESLDPTIKFVLIGDNPGISQPVSNELDLVKAINSCSCYVNTSRLSPVPMSLMEAMSCGAPCVSTAKQEIPKIMSNENICTNDLDAMCDQIIKICNDKEYASMIGNFCRSRIVENYNMDSFVESWNSVFDSAYKLKLENTI